MAGILKKVTYGADDRDDMVEIQANGERVLVHFQKAIELAQGLRMGCKVAAQHDNAPASFWQEMDLPSIEDRPKTHKEFRCSGRVSSVKAYQVTVSPPLVALMFDGVGLEVSYEDGIKWHHQIRRAAHRAKAWAGVTGKSHRMLGHLAPG